MKLRRPSPALVISVVALIVALSGSAVAARYVISSSAQIRNGAVTGADVRNRSLHGGDLADGTVTARQIKSGLLSARGGSPTSTPAAASAASEAFRRDGPDKRDGAKAPVATLALKAGAYAIFAKTSLTPVRPADQGLVDALAKDNKTIIGRCTLDAAGDQDSAAGPIASPGSDNPLLLAMQITRTLGATGDVTLRCEAPGGGWHASDTSIVALAVGSSTRTESTP